MVEKMVENLARWEKLVRMEEIARPVEADPLAYKRYNRFSFLPSPDSIIKQASVEAPPVASSDDSPIKEALAKNVPWGEVVIVPGKTDPLEHLPMKELIQLNGVFVMRIDSSLFLRVYHFGTEQEKYQLCRYDSYWREIRMLDEGKEDKIQKWQLHAQELEEFKHKINDVQAPDRRPRVELSRPRC